MTRKEERGRKGEAGKSCLGAGIGRTPRMGEVGSQLTVVLSYVQDKAFFKDAMENKILNLVLLKQK